MTEDELKKVKFKWQGHMSLESEYTQAYSSEDGMLGFCDHTPIRKNGDLGRTYRHYRIGKKIYKSKEKFLEALKDYDHQVQDQDSAAV